MARRIAPRLAPDRDPNRLARTRYLPAGLGRAGSSAQGAFHRLDARHRCRAGLARDRCSATARSPRTLLARHAPAPPSRGAAVPCYPTRSSSPSRAPRTTRGRCLSPTSATDLQHEHPRIRWIPALFCETPRGISSAGERSFDAALPASAEPATPFLRRGAPYRNGAALRRLVRPLATLRARPLTPLVAPRPPRVSRSFQRAWVASAAPPSRSPASATRSGSARASPSCAALGTCSRRSLTQPGGAFHRQVLSRRPLSRTPREPATVLAALPPASRLRAPLAVATPAALAQGSVSSARRPSTSAITTVPEHDGGRDLPPRKPRRGHPLRGVTRAAALALRRAAGRALSGPGAVVRLAAPPAPPLGEGSFAPTPMSSGTSCHRARVRTGRRACADRRTEVPRACRRATQAPPARGLLLPSFREEGTDGRTRGAFRRAATLLGLSATTPQLVTNLWNTCGGAFSIVANSFGIDGPKECGDLIAPAPGQGRCRRDRSAPLDFCDEVRPRPDVPQNFQGPNSLFSTLRATKKSCVRVAVPNPQGYPQIACQVIPNMHPC